MYLFCMNEPALKDIVNLFYQYLEKNDISELKMQEQVESDSCFSLFNEMNEEKKSKITFANLQKSIKLLENITINGAEVISNYENPNSILNRHYIDVMISLNNSINVGEIKIFATNSCEDIKDQVYGGILLYCDGRFVKNAEYPNLFNKIQYMYGKKKDAFRIPNLIKEATSKTSSKSNPINVEASLKSFIYAI